MSPLDPLGGVLLELRVHGPHGTRSFAYTAGLPALVLRDAGARRDVLETLGRVLAERLSREIPEEDLESYARPVQTRTDPLGKQPADLDAATVCADGPNKGEDISGP